MDLRHKILTLSILNYVGCVSFFVLTLSISLTIEPINLKKSYFRISEKHNQTSVNLCI